MTGDTPQGMERVFTCPRCEVSAMRDPTKPGPDKASSRVTRGEGTPDVYVCALCGAREAFRALAKLPPVPVEDWPLSIDELQREDRLIYEAERGERARPSRMAENMIPDDPEDVESVEEHRRALDEALDGE
jgi:transcription elongation factor Elf1